ncbi:MAG TPA: choice-of-anchor Q domain-containing protein [Anaerolineales bacterium]|nr:choice-of-anchor Q domain-containing protein [Anaerolineales bacterium]
MFTKSHQSIIVRMVLVLVLIFGGFVVIPVHASPMIRYVKWDASGTNDGTSWANAYNDLQSALAVASSGDEIWVAAGTYKPTTGTDRTISFTLKSGVAVYGGFAGNELSRQQRDPTINVTILSGDVGTSEVSSDNSYHVATSSDSGQSILDGFTVIGGQADGEWPNAGGGGIIITGGSLALTNVTFNDNFADIGGGLYMSVGTSANLENVSFDSNNSATYGAGILNESGTLTVNNGTFTNNIAINDGGGINSSGSLIISNSTFSTNSAYLGAGILVSDGTATVTDSTFFGNSTSGLAGGAGIMNGGTVTVANSTFYDNAADGAGGALFNGNIMTVTNSTFANNTAYNGGGIWNGGALTVTNSTLSGQAADNQGGGIYNEAGGNLLIRNAILWGNTGGEIENIAGNMPAVTYSIVQGGYAGTGNLSADPNLGPLQNNGGLTETMALLPGSPAIDAGDDANCPATDQRGVIRSQGAHCDIGAYELDTTPPSVTSSIRADPSPTSAASVNFVVTFSEPVTGVDSNDFALHTTGKITGATISNVTGSGNIYTVTVNTGTGQGKLRLDVPVNASIMDLAGNPLAGLPFTSGESYQKVKPRK